MTIEYDPNSMECHFENCIYFDAGICTDRESREYCLEIALKTLCADKTKEEQNGESERRKSKGARDKDGKEASHHGGGSRNRKLLLVLGDGVYHHVLKRLVG